jgi:hypothetical protein
LTYPGGRAAQVQAVGGLLDALFADVPEALVGGVAVAAGASAAAEDCPAAADLPVAWRCSPESATSSAKWHATV